MEHWFTRNCQCEEHAGSSILAYDYCYANVSRKAMVNEYITTVTAQLTLLHKRRVNEDMLGSTASFIAIT